MGEFSAKFTPESPYEFTVYPSEGVLEPPGNSGTDFVLSFTPTEYGKTQVGMLVIQTDEIQWTYEVRGIPPIYTPPSGKAGVDTRIDSRLTRSLGKYRKKKFHEGKYAIAKKVISNTSF